MTDTCLPKKRAIFCFSKHPPPPIIPTPPIIVISNHFHTPRLFSPPPFIRYSRVCDFIPAGKLVHSLKSTRLKGLCHARDWYREQCSDKGRELGPRISDFFSQNENSIQNDLFPTHFSQFCLAKFSPLLSSSVNDE